jgi:transposase
MSKRRFSPEQVADLLRNPNVAKCSSKAISYNSDFKILAVKQYNEEGLPVRCIFEKAGFDLSVIGHEKPKQCLESWREKAKLKGLASLAIDHRGKKPGGGRPRTKGMTDAEKITRLEATVAYLKAENDFLVKLRAQRKS